MEVIPSDSVVSSSIRTYGEWAQTELDMLGSLLKKGDHVLDVGAFIGTHSLAFAHFVGPQGHVTSFEPRPELFAVLEANLKQYNACEQVDVRQCAVGAERGHMRVPPLDLHDSINFGTSSMTEEASNEGGVEVEVVRIDDLGLDQLDLMKIDVEGMEAEVLRGAIGAIDRFHPFIFAECNSLAAALPVIEIARQHGFTVWGWIDEAFNPDNFRGATENIFGNAAENGLLLVPSERRSIFDKQAWHLMAGEIVDADSLALLMFHKPQYPQEVLASTPVAQRLGLDYPSPWALRLNERLEAATAQAQALFAPEIKQLKEKNKQLKQAVESAERWQGSWFKRTFHRWHRPVIKNDKKDVTASAEDSVPCTKTKMP
jgi:FkbM family methyltransferase